MFSPKRILVPTDFSKHSDKALGKAIEIAHEYGSKVYLLHVVNEQMAQCAMDYCIDPEVLAQMTTEGLSASKEMLGKQAKKASGANGVVVVSGVRQGIPYKEILDYVTKNKMDLIVMSPQGRSGIMGHLMGSVADKVVNHSTVPVLLLRD